MTAATLEEAIDIVNEVDYGLTSGLHSLDRGEISTWLDRIEAGSLYVNRGITGAIVERQPFGGWKKSSVGAGAKAGGPNYLVNLGSWVPAAPAAGSAPSADSATTTGSAPSTGPARAEAPAATAVPDAPALLPAVTALLAAARRSPLVGDDALASLTRAAQSDARVWSDRFGAAVDVSQVAAEHNVFRYRPAGGTVVRAGSAAPTVEVLRVVAAALRSGDAATVTVSDPELAALLEELPDGLPLTVQVETDAQWAASLAGQAPARLRLIGTPADEVVAATAGRPDVAVWSGPVTEAGRLELLPFLREQAVSITAHRFGTPDRALAELVEAL
jgi:RHH-type proline utilization regulon transcriptional repressor/proline dehydrogenase/delta 1-pyrroline-5-carboxylate dehydrogenase